MPDRGSLFAFSTAVMFATFGIFAKYIYAYNLSSIMIFFLSSLFSVLILLSILLHRYKDLKFITKIKRRDFKLSFLGTGLVGLFLTNIFVLMALQYIGVGLQKVITYSNPLFTILVYRFFFKKKMSKNEVIGVTLMILGLVLTVGNAAITSNLFYGVLFSLLAAFFSSTNSMLTETFRTSLDVVLYWFYSFLGSTFFSLLVMLLSGESLNIFPLLIKPKLMILIILCATLNFVLPYLAFFKAVITIGAVRTGIVMTTSPALTAILGAILLGEKMTLLQVFGIIIIIAASIVSALKVDNAPPPESLKVGI
ncbi:MAG: DMT family transporter [Rickettsiales bacterium]|jgi:drug/metabolite transporter (DMT)-like permease|nr:DMT family transporter [Rickettsiales bacterium]